MKKSATLLLTLTLALGIAALGDDNAPKNTENTAEFIIELTDKIEWPADVMDANKGVITITVVGDSLLTSKLREMAESTETAGGKLEIKSALPDDDFSSTEILFIAGQELSDLAKILKSTEGMPVLTITDVEGFARYGVIIEISDEKDSKDSEIKFILNKMVLKKSGLKMSDKLIKKAIKVFG
ncbi:MAG: YfiR family protein [Candidatus Zixiibacteriota bacterium]|nr:MAG: YfiR family protein [candidate division Zixibacteria bacterium]